MFADITALGIITLLGTLIVSLAVHEAMHAYVAHSLGDRTAYDEGRLTLNPLKHIDIMTTILLPFILILMHLPPILAAKPVPFNPYSLRFGEFGAALVALAGPFTNLMLAVIAAAGMRVFDVATGTLAFTIWSQFMYINIGLFVFNMIPFPPLDGSRLLYAFAPEPVRRVMEQIESLGIMVILFILLVGIQFIGPFVTNISEAIFYFLLR